MKEPFAQLTRSRPTAAVVPDSLVESVVGLSVEKGARQKATRPKASRVLRNAEFRTIYDQGIRFSGPLFAAFCLARTGPETLVPEKHGAAKERTTARLGLTVPRAVGGAVVRNRIKRRFREVFRLHRAQLGAQWDIVLNPRKNAADVPWTEIERAFRKVIEKCGT
jgi:ribonuclease P protein component